MKWTDPETLNAYRAHTRNFIQYGKKTDCADLPIIGISYFAYQHDLKLKFRLGGNNILAYDPASDSLDRFVASARNMMSTHHVILNTVAIGIVEAGCGDLIISKRPFDPVHPQRINTHTRVIWETHHTNRGWDIRYYDGGYPDRYVKVHNQIFSNIPYVVGEARRWNFGQFDE